MIAIYNPYTLLLPEWKRYLENAKSPQEVILRINQTTSQPSLKILQLATTILSLKNQETNKPLIRSALPLLCMTNFIINTYFLKPSFPEGSKEDLALKKIAARFTSIFAHSSLHEKSPVEQHTTGHTEPQKTQTPPPAISSLPKTGFGLPNGNLYQMCWMNSLLQMIAHSPSRFYDPLLSANIVGTQSEEELGDFYNLQIAINECVDALRANKRRSLEDQIICAESFEEAFSHFEEPNHLPKGITHDAFEVFSRLLLRIDAKLPEIKMSTDWQLSDTTTYTLPETESALSLKLSVSRNGQWLQQLLKDDFAKTAGNNLERIVLRDKDNKIIDMYATNYKFNDFKKELGAKAFLTISEEKKVELQHKIISTRIEKKMSSVTQEQLRNYTGSIFMAYYFGASAPKENFTLLNTMWERFCEKHSIKPTDRAEYVAFAHTWIGDLVLPKLKEEDLHKYRQRIVLKHNPTITTVTDNDLILALGEEEFQALSKETIDRMQKAELTKNHPSATSITCVQVESKQKIIDALPDHMQIVIYRPLDTVQTVHITERIDLGLYMRTPQKAIYRLDQIFIHTGDNAKGTGGHYYCYIRQGNYWVCYDDPHVTVYSSFDKIQQTINRFGYAGVWSKEVE